MESDIDKGLPSRLRLCVGNDSVSAFARRCQLPEATVRSYLESKKPVYDKLVKIADAAGVTVDWLATGRGPRTRKEALNQQDSAALDALAGAHARRWAKIIELVETAPTPEEAEALLDDLFARAREKTELAELRRAVKALTDAHKKTA